MGKHLGALGDATEVEKCHPNWLRYTFAIQSYSNGVNMFTLQALLGHSALKMVRYYLRLTKSDLEASYWRASLVNMWFKS